MKGEKGFTLIELAMVILIIGVLAAIAIPRYYDLVARAKTSAEQGIVGNVRAGILTYHANQISKGAAVVWPPNLDTAANGACNQTNPCFETVMETGHGVRDSSWNKTGANQYTGPVGTTTYSYNSTTGQFTG